jgi:putative tryptophan/tyrosine transport system substrate-binding protein
VRRRSFITLLGGATAWSLAAQAQQAETERRIGLLLPISEDVAAPFVDAFRQRLRERGHVEGRGIAFEPRWTDGTLADAAKAALDVVRSKVDLILAWGTPMATSAQQATTTIPIVFVGVSDPVGSGFAASLARPGGNITGLSNFARNLTGKLVELLDEIVPGIDPVVALAHSGNPAVSVQQRETEEAARILRRGLRSIAIAEPDEIDSAFVQLNAEGAKGVVVLPSPLFLSQRRKIAELAREARLPTVFARRENVDAGGLLSYGPNLRDQFAHAADYADRILRGATPASLPVEQPTRIEFVVNLKTAQEIDIALPPSIMLRADEVIE